MLATTPRAPTIVRVVAQPSTDFGAVLPMEKYRPEAETVLRLVARQLAEIVEHADLDLGALFSGTVLIAVWGIGGAFARSGLPWGVFLLVGVAQIGATIGSRVSGRYQPRAWTAFAAALAWVYIAAHFAWSTTPWPDAYAYGILALACFNGFRRYRRAS